MGNQTSSTSRKWGKKGRWGDTCPDAVSVGDADWDAVPGGSYQMYQTHDNGGRPFRVFVDKKNKVGVITLMVNSEWPEDCYPYVVNKRFSFKRVFIGKSPRNEMTETAFNGGYGRKFDGNTILFDMGDNTYMFVGDRVSLFKSNSPIVRFVSPVGQNDVPYPYALDESGTYYLIVESVKVKSLEISKDSDPYLWYYDYISLSPKSRNIRPIEFEVLVPRIL